MGGLALLVQLLDIKSTTHEAHKLLPWLSWLEREAVTLKIGSSSLPGSESKLAKLF